MIIFFLSFLTYILVITFFYSQHPLFMSTTIALQSILISTTIYLFSSTSWFGYLLFMIFLSGMMIILVYVSSLASNMLMKYFSLDLSVYAMFLTLALSFFFVSQKANIFYDNNASFSNSPNLVIVAGKIYSSETYLFTILIISYLLVVLILVVKNSFFTKGPLRSHM
uniref:NADH dehydrogenase subunit 6 n=1 Tax=Metacrangonyx goulmimensis TaxID=1199162 RepID=K7ZWU5_9CRUS|nr:NADH dehydrogenase subunit 6 [Metacrangonyx goulmimensis]CCI69530.1 NADH dehydrogenase subunit 6 [Metacrangonyx goulmimensis]